MGGGLAILGFRSPEITNIVLSKGATTVSVTAGVPSRILGTRSCAPRSSPPSRHPSTSLILDWDDTFNVLLP